VTQFGDYEYEPKSFLNPEPFPPATLLVVSR
jgi:hypothetical protein